MSADARQGIRSPQGRESPLLPSAAYGWGPRCLPAAWRDALAVALLTATAATLSAWLNLSELLRRWSAPWERFQLDELPGIFCILALALSWFAVRRYREAGRELRRRCAAEARLAAALADNRRLAEQYVRRQEAESKELARELHDELGQYLNVIKLDAVGIRDGRLSDEATVRDRAGAVVDNCNHIHAALAHVIRRLRPVGLDELGLAAAVEHCLDAWRRRMPHAALGLTAAGELSDLPEPVALTSYRLVQEALTNIAKHSRAQRVLVALDRAPAGCGGSGDELRIQVSDDGVGSDPDASTRGLGLIGMRERVAALDGAVEVASEPGRGFRLVARIPVRQRP